MAVAISAAALSDKTASQTTAGAWTALSAGVALLATVPLFLMLSGPVTSLMFVRGSAYNQDWSRASTLLLVLLAPVTYALFFATTGELLKSRVSQRVHSMTMRVAAVAMLPYVVMVTSGVFWKSGPQESLILSAALTIPIAMGATTWASTQNH